ncbi:diaminobutyrate--2-oxoglutarate transaminase [Thaumasiovibrio subtropicus]|uniref:diaminobutyrate--2-oxoglutarate transaminase n=1 Tax=Thaumasiovibrio subtropicus TaxID=1891207 RepID=UPI000B354031|nr:diaminobutyrate--2-oxoglutarate transaminase [Thaumasiovibrio subtropicus]
MSIFKQQESQVQSYARSFPVTFKRANGCWLTTKDDQQYLDFLAGAGSLNYGHNNPLLKDALIKYISDDGIAHGLDMHSSAKADFLTAFRNHILKPRNLDYKVQFTGPTGTNAVEAALKLARKVTGRQQIVAFTNGFHGCSMGALAATGNQHHRGGAGAPLQGISRIPFEGYANIDGLSLFETMLSDNSSGLDKPAAVLLETVQGEGGLNVASSAWLQRLSSICNRHDILLIIDDIQAGCGRTGTFFSFEPSGIKPDIVTLSKSISGFGLPMALVLLSPELDIWAPGEHNGTFRGNNHAFVTATATIELYWRNNQLEQHIAERATQITQSLEQTLAQYPQLFSEIKGRGLMQGISCRESQFASDISKLCFKNGMIIETAGPNDEVVKFFCPLTITEDELTQGLSIFQNAVNQLALTLTKKAS